MKTNNKEFTLLNTGFILIIIINIVLLFIIQQYSLTICFIVIIDIVIILLFYAILKNNLSKNIKYIRDMINKIDQDSMLNEPREGDLGLLNEKLILLNRKYKYDVKNLKREKIDLLHYHENISHQLKTPLSSIRINEEIKYMETNDEIYYENIKLIDHMDHLLDDILNIARFENNAVTLDFSKINLKKTIIEAISKIRIDNQKIDLELEDIYFYQDELWLQEAFINIIKNSIRKDVTLIKISISQNNQYIKCIIKDNGKGIEDDNIIKIFNRYYRSSNNETKGFGIGLALANEIIKAHHGYIHVYNEQGAVFEIMFIKYNLKE